MIDKTFAIIDELDNNITVKKIKAIKRKIKNNQDCKSLINNFNNSKELYEKYGALEEFANAKKALYENEYLRQYVNLQSEINDLSFYINEKFKRISKSTTCNK